ncbi:MAG: glycosyltransferase family 4 protein [Acidobacteriota bacterium]|nr:glycosyltransferase family 4 protein [Acidobacteriota bacterium]
MRIHQVLATLGYGDAIGHEVLGIQRVLRKAGYDSEIIVETADRRLEDLTIDYRDAVGYVDADDVLIHHFSLGSRASRTAFALPARMALIYHNITPPEFYVGIHPQLMLQCYRGLRELRAYVPRVDLALGDSEFNRHDLESYGFTPTGVLPVVPDFSHLDQEPDTALAGQFDDDWVNILFVGRFVPNKKPEDLVRFFHAYKRIHNPRARLILAGSYAGFDDYYAQVRALISRLGASDVHILGQVSDEELTALYDIADVFLSASEHEGFCVPLLEAFHKDVPVIAFAATAVPETMDGAGVLYAEKDPALVASLINAIVSDAALREALLDGQTASLSRHTTRDFDRILLGHLDRMLSMPRKPMPDIAWDFWRQFEEAERLEELRQVRPSAFKALPRAPEASVIEREERDR